MRIIRAPTLARAHELAVKMVLEKGKVLVTENGEATVESDEIAMRIENPLAEPMASVRSRFQRKFLDRYAENLLKGSASVFEYDYHGRLFDWGERLCSEGQDVHIDQIRYITDKLRSSATSRRAIAITWNPVIDEGLADCPCLQLVQCLVRDSAFHMKVVFRSNDMLSAAGANMYALARLQQNMAETLGMSCGAYTHISLVPHIYYTRDIADIPPFCEKGDAIQPVAEVCEACNGCTGRHRKERPSG